MSNITHLQSKISIYYYFLTVEREGQPKMDDNWDSLSVRMRRQRRLRLNGKSWNYHKHTLVPFESRWRCYILVSLLDARCHILLLWSLIALIDGSINTVPVLVRSFAARWH